MSKKPDPKGKGAAPAKDTSLDAILKPKLAAEGLRPTDGVADMTHISDIDVDGINTNLRVRYKKDEIYTYSGTILVAVNPYKFLSIYEMELISKYQNRKMGDLPPHIFATAEAAFQNVKTTSTNQSCVISGESGAGKTETTKFILQYLCAVTSSVTKWVEQQILEANVILEAFGNARTVRNDNSSRFGKFMQVCFDAKTEIKGCIIQEYLLEQSRITFQSAEERNYHVFYQLVAGADKQQFLLDPIESYNYLNQSGCYKLEDVDDSAQYEELRKAMMVLHIEEELMEGIFSLVSAVLQIGNLEFRDLDGESMSLTDKDKKTIAKIATLLALTPEQISEIVTSRQIVVRGSATTIPYKIADARENRHAMAKALYSRTFTWLVDRINQTTNPGSDTNKFIGVLDIFGFENFAINSFEQLCINFTNEKLHKFFNHYVFALEQAEYTKEGINFAHISFTDNSLCLEVIEKPPSCVLRLLDEECRFPKGSDASFLQKMHDALVSHSHYIKGDDKTKWDREFGIRHFAGDVQYNINSFLEKNKDVMQDQLFEYMRGSKKAFIRDVTKFQDLLANERRIIVSDKQLPRTESKAADKSLRRSTTSADDLSRTNKAKPTVGDTFRKQLAALVDVLESTTPWYVRCIKPNSQKQNGIFDETLVRAQLQYSGMLDIVRIRKEGFPVHVPAERFVEKYHSLAQIMGVKLSTEPKEATKQILTYVKAPATEWQIGKTKVFLRNSVFEPLEEKLRILLQVKVILIQKVFRGFKARREYKKSLLSVVRIQAAVRGAALRWRYLKMRRAAIKIQAATRGWRDREYVKEMRRKIKEEEERKKREEEERRRAEAAEKGAQLMEDSFIKAQKELFAMAKMAELKANDVNKTGDLDQVFNALASERKDKTDSAITKTVNDELDAMFSGKESKPAGKRTMRRKKRVEKKMLYEMQQEEAMKQEEVINPAEYSMYKFAQKYFNDHPKNASGTMTARARRASADKIDDPMPKEEMIVYTKNTSLPTSLVHLHNPENVNIALNIFKDLCKQMKGDLKPEQATQSIQSIVAYCLERQELRDEVFCQLIKQTSNNPKPDSQLRGWQILAVLCTCFPPSKLLHKYLMAYVKLNQNDSVVGGVAKYSMETINKVKINGPRRLPPSMLEVDAVTKQTDIVCRFYFLDGKAKALTVHPASTAEDTIRDLAQRIGLRDVSDGWAIFESTPEAEHFIRGHEYIGDILAEWETSKFSSMQLSKYQTMNRKGGHAAALGGGEAKFVFRKRLFRNPAEIPTDPVEYGLIFAQAVHSVVKVDEFPVSEKVALQLAGLQAQVLWGDPTPDNLSRYEDIENYVPFRIRAASNKTKEQWVQDLFNAQKEFGKGKSDMQAKVTYLTAVRQYPLYGGSFFDANYKGFWSFPNRLLVSVHYNCVKFVNHRTKEVLMEFDYSQLKNIEVNAYDETITFNMEPRTLDEPSHYMFTCTRKEDMANLIASYSPAHRNWKQVGVAAVSKRKATEDEKSRVLNELRQCRKELVESGMLRKPAESKGFLATTLRRTKSSTKLKKEDEDFEKVFEVKYWSYSKSKLAQPLSMMNEVDGDEVALRMFNSLLIFSGLLTAGGFEIDDDPGHVELVQNVIARCLEREDCCNEFYLQLIKQTTDQPDPNGRINVQNWRMFALTLGIVVPRAKALLNYLNVHLRRCGLDTETEEGKFAQFCLTVMNRTIENKNRKYPPSRQEVLCVSKRQPVYARFHFMDGEYRALVFDSAATTAEVVAMVRERIGLPTTAQGFSLFEVFGSLERNMLGWEKVADAMFKWEKYAKSTHSQKELKLTFKQRLFIPPLGIPKHQVEFDLVFHQALDDIKQDRFPITPEECAYVAALKSQVELGDLDPKVPTEQRYNNIIERYLPKHVRGAVLPEDIATHHGKLKGYAKQECNMRLLKFVMSWPLFGSTVFEVLQAYTTTLPKNLWLAVNSEGIHIMKRRSKEPLISYSYRNIVNYSPSLRNLMIVTESLTRGTKFVFNTSQASQIAHLIKDYTQVILQRKKMMSRSIKRGSSGSELGADANLANVKPDKDGEDSFRDSENQ